MVLLSTKLLKTLEPVIATKPYQG